MALVIHHTPGCRRVDETTPTFSRKAGFLPATYRPVDGSLPELRYGTGTPRGDDETLSTVGAPRRERLSQSASAALRQRSRSTLIPSLKSRRSNR